MIVAFSVISKPIAFQYVNCIYAVYGTIKLYSSWFCTLTVMSILESVLVTVSFRGLRYQYCGISQVAVSFVL